MSDKRAALQAEREQIEARQRRREEAADKDRGRLRRIEGELHRLDLLKLAGIPDAVQVRFRVGPGDHLAHLNDLRGTITAVRRTQTTVVFSNGEEWTWPISELKPAGEPQGFAVGVSTPRPQTTEAVA